MSTAPRYAAAELRVFAETLLARAGATADQARDIAEILLEGDLLGHTTHGLALLAPYLDELAAGRMSTTGAPDVVSDHGATLTWDGGYRPGPWLIRRAISEAQCRLERHALSTVAIRRSHHIACLQAYLKPVTDAGLFILLACTDPANRWVAPPGGIEPRYSPNPVAAGIPTSGAPILVDISLSTTSANACLRAAKADAALPGRWLTDRHGNPTSDPRPLVERREGGLYPLGGSDLGYKGFALALIMEALTSALAGHGRADGDARWGCSVFLLLIDPDRFGGRAAFVRETTFLAEACRSTPTPPHAPPVRLPGDDALARRWEQLARGVALYPEIMPALRPWAERFAVPMPKALRDATADASERLE